MRHYLMFESERKISQGGKNGIYEEIRPFKKMTTRKI